MKQWIRLCTESCSPLTGPADAYSVSALRNEPRVRNLQNGVDGILDHSDNQRSIIVVEASV